MRKKEETGQIIIF